MRVLGFFVGHGWLALLMAACVAQGQTEWDEVRPKRTNDYDERKGEGYCAIRVWVDDVVVIHTRGDRVTFETVRGQRARDAGTECSQPMPAGAALADFRFRGIDGRGRVELIEPPDSRNNYTAKVRIEDTRSGGQEHHFRLSWRNLRPGSGAGGSSDPGGVGGSPWQGRDYRQTLTGRGRGRVGNLADVELYEARLDLRANGEFSIELVSDGVYQFEGRWTSRSQDAVELEIRERAGGSNAEGRGTLTFRGGRMERLEADGRFRRSGNTFRMEFDAGRGRR